MTTQTEQIQDRDEIMNSLADAEKSAPARGMQEPELRTDRARAKKILTREGYFIGNDFYISLNGSPYFATFSSPRDNHILTIDYSLLGDVELIVAQKKFIAGANQLTSLCERQNISFKELYSEQSLETLRDYMTELAIATRRLSKRGNY